MGLPRPEEWLKELLDKIESSKIIDDSRIIDLVVRTRRLLEKKIADIQKQEGLPEQKREQIIKETRERYSLLIFFCHWAVHPEISRSKTGWWILKEITNILVANAHTEDTNAIIMAISNTLAPQKLREQFVSLYKEYNLPAFIFENTKDWIAFYSGLITYVRDTPITIDTTRQKGRKILQSIEERTENSFFKNPTEFWVSGEINKPLYWNVKVFVQDKGEITIKSNLKCIAENEDP